MSSLGDIVQAFHVLDSLRSSFPDAIINWVTEEAFVPLVSSHPYVNQVFSLNLKELKKGWRKFFLWKKLFGLLSLLRGRKYDLLLDLQGNCKSALVTFLSKARLKVGFGYHCVREKPNILATHLRFDVPQKMNIREQYLELVRKIGGEEIPFSKKGVALAISLEEKEQIEKIFKHPCLQTKIKMMVCPGSQWVNKKIPLPILLEFLKKIEEKIRVSFLLVWGSEAEKNDCEMLQKNFPQNSIILDKLPLTVWQNVMREVDVVLAVDSSALHLCGITETSSFSIFGPTSPKVFKPIGAHHFAIQGVCPYGKQFDKTCPLLRTCSTGACMKNLKAEDLADAFFRWWEGR